MGFPVFDEPKIDFHEVFGSLLMSTLTFTIISINIFSLDGLSPVDRSLVHFGVLNKFLMSLSDKLKNFRVFTTILKEHLKGLY